MDGVVGPIFGGIAILCGTYLSGKEQGKRENDGRAFKNGLSYLLDRLGYDTEYVEKLKDMTPHELTDFLESLFDQHIEEVSRYYFKEGWRRAEEKANHVDEDKAKLAEILRVDPHEKDINVWKKAKREFMLAHHPDRNKWADPEFVASVNSLYDKVFK